MNPPATERDGKLDLARQRWPLAAVIGLLGLYGVIAYSAALNQSFTWDEPLHLLGGYSYWQLHDYRLHPENGHLPQRLFGLSLYFLSEQPELPELEGPMWHASAVVELGRLFIRLPSNETWALLAAGRMPAVLLGMCLCLVIFLWSRQIFGLAGGLISLSAAALSPTLLAHGGLMTSDLCAALFFMLATWACWGLLHRVSWWRLLAATGAVGGLFLSKVSAVLLVPVVGLLVLVRFVAGPGIVVGFAGLAERCLERWWQKGILALGLTLFFALTTAGLIWAVHGFRFDAMHPELTRPSSHFRGFDTIDEACETADSLPAEMVRWAHEHQLLPEAYLFGVAFVAARTQKRRAYAAGEYSLTGWWWYFPYAAAIKTPWPVFGLLFLAGWSIWRQAPQRQRELTSGQLGYRLLPVVVLAMIFAAVLVRSTLNIGHRHMLVIYPVLFVVLGAVGPWITHRWGKPLAFWRRVLPLGLAVALLGWLGVETARVWPEPLAYFNQSVGGPMGGYRYLSDSNVDWGQGLPTLAQWLEANPPIDGQERPVFYEYFGLDDPQRYGIDARALWSNRFADASSPLPAGRYCIDATSWSSVYQRFPGRWNRVYEREYRRLQSWVLAFASLNREARDQWLNDSERKALATYWTMAYQSYRISRLLAFLRDREPDARAGPSWLIYELPREFLDEVEFGTTPPETQAKPFPPRPELLLGPNGLPPQAGLDPFD